MFFFCFFFISGESHEPSEGTQFLWMVCLLFPACLILCCLRYLCCKTSETDSQASPVEPDQTHPPQYNANTFNTNFSSQAQYSNAGFSSGQPSQPQMGFSSSFNQPAYYSYSSPDPATSSAGGFIQPPRYEEAVQGPSVNQYGK